MSDKFEWNENLDGSDVMVKNLKGSYEDYANSQVRHKSSYFIWLVFGFISFRSFWCKILKFRMTLVGNDLRFGRKLCIDMYTFVLSFSFLAQTVCEFGIQQLILPFARGFVSDYKRRSLLHSVADYLLRQWGTYLGSQTLGAPCQNILL